MAKPIRTYVFSYGAQSLFGPNHECAGFTQARSRAEAIENANVFLRLLKGGTLLGMRIVPRVAKQGRTWVV